MLAKVLTENLKMDSQEKKRKLSTPEIASPSLSTMDLKKKKKKKQKLSTSEIAGPSPSKMDFKKKKKKKKQKLSKSLVIASPSTLEKDLVLASPALSKEDMEEAMKKRNDVDMFLTGIVISALATDYNFVFSPASINSTLAMLAATTEQESLRAFILSFLRSSSTDELKAVFHEIASVVLVDVSKRGGPKISSVNGVWMAKSLPVNPLAKDLIENFFKASFAQVDFSIKVEDMRMGLNSWAERHTNGLIKDIFPPDSITSVTTFVYGNALYFKGAWKDKFDKDLTENRPFHLFNGGTVSVPFMSSDEKQYIGDYDGFKVLQLPFRECANINRSFSMHIYLPDEKDGLNDLVKKITSTPGFVDNHIPRSKFGVNEFRIPKFKVEFGLEASKVFNESDLDSISLYHKALVEIDEDGAEAASATFVIPFRGRGCGMKRKIDFVADHPFLFLIREDTTGIILFVGQIFDPSKSSST